MDCAWCGEELPRRDCGKLPATPVDKSKCVRRQQRNLAAELRCARPACRPDFECRGKLQAPAQCWGAKGFLGVNCQGCFSLSRVACSISRVGKAPAALVMQWSGVAGGGFRCQMCPKATGLAVGLAVGRGAAQKESCGKSHVHMDFPLLNTLRSWLNSWLAIGCSTASQGVCVGDPASAKISAMPYLLSCLLTSDLFGAPAGSCIRNSP